MHTPLKGYITEPQGKLFICISDVTTRKFVLKAGLQQNQGYIVEANILLQSGRLSKSIWIINTDFLPYGGSCSTSKSRHFGLYYI